MPDDNLIYDLGLFEGQDSQFYLSKGFRVVALEAHPEYAAAAANAFSGDIAANRMVLVHRAMWTESGQTISFHTRGAQSSVFKEAADSGGPSVPFPVQTVTLPDLFDAYGVPRYLKCDLEGADEILVDQLEVSPEKPTFLSIETDNPASIKKLANLGYDRFQIVNQQYHSRSAIPNPAREGRYINAKLDVENSGLFGLELPPNLWLSQEAAINALALRARLVAPDCNRLTRYAYRRWGRLSGRNWLIPTGWTDVHACRQQSL